jgi:hypothetical protein
MCLVFTDSSDSPRAKFYNSPASSVTINNSAKLSCIRLWKHFLFSDSMCTKGENFLKGGASCLGMVGAV